MQNRFLENKKLQQVFDKVWINPEEALDDLEKISAIDTPKALTPSVADARLLRLILNVLLQRFENLDLEQQQLKAYYATAKDSDKAALVTIWCMYGWIMIGRLDIANNRKQEFPKIYSPEYSPLAYACYYVFSCVYCEKNGYYEDFVSLAQETETHLQKHIVSSEWHYSLLCQARNYRSRTYSNYNRAAEAIELMQQTEGEIDKRGLCNWLKESVQYSYVMHYENIGERLKAIAVLENIVAASGKRKYSDIAKYISIANLVNTYSLRNRQLEKSNSEYRANQDKQLYWLGKADNIVSRSFVTSTTAFYYYVKAGVLIQENKLPEALQAIAKSILIFYRYYNIRFIAQAYTTAYKIYKAGAIANADYRMAYKAARCSDQMRLMTDKYYKQVLNRRIEALELQFKIKEKELNEALLQQQINAMNKEVQLTTLSLHEKIQVLDEIKSYVHSLKKKELETRQLINTIAKKIDSVKITEAEKATLQHKLSDANHHLNKTLAEKYPMLSTMEIQMCGLFQTGMTNKELSKLYGQSEKSYEQHRYRIKKKMGLGIKEKLVSYLVALSAGNTD